MSTDTVFGNRSAATHGDGFTTTWSIDPARQRLTSVATSGGGVALQAIAYTYDPASNPTQITNTLAALGASSGAMPASSSVTLTYDGVDRLTHAVGQASLTYNTTTSYDQTFGYSASHNLLQKNRTHIVTDASGIPATQPATTFSSTYGYGAARPHLPTTIGTMALQYDASGNPTLRQTPGLSEVLVWDDDNRLVQATATGIDQFNTHDAAGLRVLRRSSQGETIFASQYFDLDNSTQGIKHVFAGSLKVASELTPYTAPSGAPVTWSRPAPPTQAGTAYYFHLDHLGSTGVLTNSTGQVQESLEYFVDGEAWIDRGIPDPVNSYLFSGKPYDSDTGFYDFGQRFYDPRTSSWLGVDATFRDNAATAIGHPILAAPVAYAAHSPLAHVDPDGRCPICIGIIVLGALLGGEETLDEPRPSDAAVLRHMVAGAVTASSFGVAGRVGAWAAGASPTVASRLVGASLGGAGGAIVAQGGADIGNGTLSSLGDYAAAAEFGGTLGFAAEGMSAGTAGLLRTASGKTPAIVAPPVELGASIPEWRFGDFKSPAKWGSQMTQRGWTPEQITEAMQRGERFPANNLVNKSNTATRFVHPETRRSVVVDDVTKEVIHVGGNGFGY